MPTRILVIGIVMVLLVAAMAGESLRQSAVSPSEKRLIQREYIRARVDELSSVSLEQLRQRIATRTVESIMIDVDGTNGVLTIT